MLLPVRGESVSEGALPAGDVLFGVQCTGPIEYGRFDCTGCIQFNGDYCYGVLMTLLTTLLLIVASVFTAPPDRQWGGPNSGASAIQIELITDADGFSDAWKRTHGGSLEGLPSVDFTQARVVLALSRSDRRRRLP